MNKMVRYGLFLILLGLTAIFSSLWAEEHFATPSSEVRTVTSVTGAVAEPTGGTAPPAPAPSPIIERNHHVILILKLVDEVGITLLLLGAVVMILEFPDWQDYFQEQIVKVIVDQEYLKEMSGKDLIRLQTNALIAFFKTDDIDRNESFLHFFQSRIHKYIGDPYREDVRELISIRYSEGRKDQVDVEETMSYRCRRVGDRTQDEVRWVEEGRAQVEQLTLGYHDVEIAVPPETFADKKFALDHPNVCLQRTIFQSTDPTKPLLYEGRGKGKGFRRSLKDYQGVDDLHVKTHVRYTMPTNMPFTWTMSNPTKGITGTITYPPDLNLVTNMFGVTEDEVNREDKPGLCQLDYDSWLLTDTGFSFQLIAKPPTGGGVAPPPSAPTATAAGPAPAVIAAPSV